MKKVNKFLALALAFALVLTFVPGFEIPVTYAMDNIGENQVTEQSVGITEIIHLTEVPEGYTGIYTKADLDAVRNNLAGNYILMNDIVFTDSDFAEGGDFYNGGEGWISIGKSTSVVFSGIFDGNGYTIKNLYINCIKGAVYVGLFGYVTGTIQNLGMIDSNITTSQNGNAFCGGIVGYLSGGTVDNCYNTGLLSATSTANTSTAKYSYAGGIVGYLSSGTVKNCYNMGSAIATASKGNSAYAGGIVGNMDNGTVENCYNTGDVSATPTSSSAYAGGIVGYSSGTVSNCYNTGSIFTSSSSTRVYAGGIAGSSGTVTNCYNSGDVSSSSPYASTGGIAGSSGTVNNCRNEGSVSAINATSSATGDIYAGGIVGTIPSSSGTVTNCHNTGNATSSRYAGGIAGYSNYGTMSRSYNSGYIKSSYGSGGICGYGYDATALECCNAGTVEGDAYSGGIVGHGYSFNKIEDCYNSGAIFSDSGYSGGLIAAEKYSDCYLRRCYNTGFVSDGSSISGYNSYIKCENVYYFSSPNLFMKQNTKYGVAVRDVSSAAFAGFDFETVWVRDPSGIPRLRWEKNIAITELSVESAMSLPWKESRVLTPDFGVENPTHKELIWTSSDSTIASVSPWGEVFANSVGTARITVSTFSGDKTATCVVTVSSPDTVIEISTPEDLGKIGYEYPLDGYYRLTADLDLSTYTSANGLFYNDGNGWTPIGDENNPFTGAFDGGNHSIEGLTTASSQYAGLFGYAQNATIVGIEMKNSSISGTYTGSILGYGVDVLIKDCVLSGGTISGSTLGGIAGYMDGNSDIYACTSNAVLHGTGSTGGIVGYTSGWIYNCVNYCSFEQTDSNVGGLAGYCYGAYGCANYGNVSVSATVTYGTIYAGGIAGKSEEIFYSKNMGSVKGIGSSWYNSNYSRYDTCDAFVGGISGSGYAGECYNVGAVSHSVSGASGAIIGNAGTIQNCFSLSGEFGNATVENSYTVSGKVYLGAELALFNTRQLQLQNTYTGWDFKNIWTISENRYPTLRNVPFVFAQGVDFSEEEGILYIGETYMLEPIFDPENATYQKVTYSSLNTAIATVNDAGVITPIAPGMVIIKGVADDGGAVAEYELTVRRHVSKVTLDKTTATIAVPNALQLTETVTEADAYDRSVFWTSSDDSIATVDSTGFVTAVKAGTATITVTTNDGGYTATCKVTVTQPVLGLEIAPEAVTLPVGKTQQIAATVLPDDATVKTVTYSSDKTTVATVSSSGLITAKAPGTANITVKTTDGNIVKICTVTVVRLATGISLNVTAKTLTVNDTFKPTVTFSPSDTTDKTVSWTSSDETVASVAEDGTLTAKKAGFANITATSNDGGYTKSYTVMVIQPPMGISLPDTATVIVGTPLKFDAVITPADTTDKTVTWTSSNTSVATVDANGTVTGLKNGTVTITAVTAGNEYNDTCIVTVIMPVSGVSLSNTSLVLYVGNGAQLTATITPASATDKRVTWNSDNTSVLTVDENGKLTALKSGTATVTVTSVDGSYTATCTVTVRQHVEEITLDEEAVTLKVGSSDSIIATVNPVDAYNKSVSWSSSDASVAKVDANGVVTAVKAGTAVITAKTSDGGLVATCSVTVTQPVTGVSLNKSQLTLYAGEGAQLTATVAPADSLNKNVRWTSSDDTVITIDETGRIQALKGGSATITVTTVDGEYTATCSVTVRNRPVSIDLDYEALTMRIGDKQTLVSSIAPVDADYDLTWSSDNEAVAYVNQDGRISALSEGTAKITVETDNGLSVTCIVTIIKAFDLSDDYQVDANGYITVTKNTNVEDLIYGLDSSCTVSITDKNGTSLDSSDIVGTGDRIVMENNRNETVTYTIVVLGDLNGDGAVNAIDVSMFAQSLVGNGTLNNVQKDAADLNGDNLLDSLDLFALKKCVIA